MLIGIAITIRLLAKRKTTQLTQVIKDPNMGKVNTWTDLSTAIILHLHAVAFIYGLIKIQACNAAGTYLALKV